MIVELNGDAVSLPDDATVATAIEACVLGAVW